MLAKQISVFIENKKGRLADITRLLAEHEIDISAISIADTANFGILRMIVASPDKALHIINNAGYTAHTTEVVAVEVEDRPGGLNSVLVVLNQENISVEYLYSFLRTMDNKALILFKVENAKKAAEVLLSQGIKVLTQEEVNKL
jgi:hypothetical protein